MQSVVIKLSGQIVGYPQCDAWLEAIIQRGNCVVVPGGGAYADAVRSAQKVKNFSDAIAHRLALYAMTQTARDLVARCPLLKESFSLSAVEQTLQRQQTPIWSPADLLDGHPEIEESWELSSDSLALWCAAQLGAAECVLVKAGELPAGPVDIHAWSQVGFLDAHFPHMAQRTAIPWRAVTLGSDPEWGLTPNARPRHALRRLNAQD
jgi:aspartokinase-like uncharacterized kinase